MKSTTLTIITLLLAGTAFGQSKKSKTYWKIESYFTLSNGCESSAISYPETYNGYSINYNDAKKLIANWVKPLKIKSFKITSMQHITKSEYAKYDGHGEKFKCPETIKISMMFDTLTPILIYKKSDVKFINDSTLIIKKQQSK